MSQQTPEKITVNKRRSKALVIFIAGILLLGVIIMASIYIPPLIKSSTSTSDSFDSPQNGSNGDVTGDNNYEIVNVEDGFISFEDSGISFTYSEDMANAASLETIEAVEEFMIVYPKHRQVVFGGYRFTDSVHSPVIMIFPLEEYRSMNDDAANNISRLESIISQGAFPVTDDSLPFLPEQMAAQIFYASAKYLSSEWSSGVRYLTQYGQDIWPVTNDTLFYTYQGITGDGQFYISAVSPVRYTVLPSDSDEYFTITGQDYKLFEEDYTNYLEGLILLFNNACDDEYLPSLHMLDRLIETFKAEPF